MRGLGGEVIEAINRNLFGDNREALQSLGMSSLDQQLLREQQLGMFTNPQMTALAGVTPVNHAWWRTPAAEMDERWGSGNPQRERLPETSRPPSRTGYGMRSYL